MQPAAAAAAAVPAQREGLPHQDSGAGRGIRAEAFLRSGLPGSGLPVLHKQVAGQQPGRGSARAGAHLGRCTRGAVAVRVACTWGGGYIVGNTLGAARSWRLWQTAARATGGKGTAAGPPLRGPWRAQGRPRAGAIDQKRRGQHWGTVHAPAGCQTVTAGSGAAAWHWQQAGRAAAVRHRAPTRGQDWADAGRNG